MLSPVFFFADNVTGLRFKMHNIITILCLVYYIDLYIYIHRSRDLFAATDGGARPGHEVVSQSCLGRSSEWMY